MDNYTEDFGEIVSHAWERSKAIDILKAWDEYGLPDGFDNVGVKLAFNCNSGYVFLVNADYQVAMLGDYKLEIYHTLPYSGEEGFLSEFSTSKQYHPDDAEYLINWGLPLVEESEASE